ncbi:hypothetical protein RIF29_27264 [Crotalaria pallida]|uniref:Uncharacterized protein n=1 Tax=Crotalaria pallida TaxID=3830 RepID=A0AAN9EPE4_CROPI
MFEIGCNLFYSILNCDRHRYSFVSNIIYLPELIEVGSVHRLVCCGLGPRAVTLALAFELQARFMYWITKKYLGYAK